jgi:hypothetical protein
MPGRGLFYLKGAMSMRQLTPKPGDIFIVLNNGQESITYLLPRDKVSDLQRQRMNKLTEAFRVLFVEGHDELAVAEPVIEFLRRILDARLRDG